MIPISTSFFFFFFNDTATTEIYTLSLHDALPIYRFLLHSHLQATKRPSPPLSLLHSSSTLSRRLGVQPIPFLSYTSLQVAAEHNRSLTSPTVLLSSLHHYQCPPPSSLAIS